MNKLKVVADDAIPFLKGVLEPYADVTYLPGIAISAGDVCDADALLVRTRTRCDERLLKGSRVQFVATATIGKDHLDGDFLSNAGIAFTNAEACNADSVLQYITDVLLEIAVATGRSLRGMTLGIVGVGNIGSRVKKRAELLGMRVLCSDPPKAGSEDFEDVPLNEIYRTADVVTFHTPLVKDGGFATLHLCDAASLAMMKPEAWVINASRGEVVDNEALIKALDAKRIAGAVLDVWENEPDISKELLDKVKFGTPHIAGYSQDGKANATTSVVRSLARHFKAGYPQLAELESFVAEPPAVETEFDVDLSRVSSSLENQLLAVFRKTYDIREDDCALRANLSDFEGLRKHYQIRREPKAHKGTVIGASEEALALLRALELTIF